MKKLNKLILTGMLSLLPLISNSPDKFEKYLPLEKKLREIELDKSALPGNICMHKTMRYYLNAKAAGEDAYLIIGHINESRVLHSWIGIDKSGKTYYLDLTYSNPDIDGFPKEFYNNRKETLIFDSNSTIKDFVYRKNLKEKNKKNIRKIGGAVKNMITEKKGYQIPLKESIENYCKQDTAAWNYYQEHIAKNK